VREPDPLQELAQARELRVYLRTVGDTVRLQILRRLAQNSEMTVTALAQALRISQPLLSWHLGVLRRIDIVSVRRDGRLMCYSLNLPVLRAFNEQFAAWIGDVAETNDAREWEDVSS
jgi:DNA-binding transcriptional ArsR family regulator